MFRQIPQESNTRDDDDDTLAPLIFYYEIFYCSISRCIQTLHIIFFYLAIVFWQFVNKDRQRYHDSTIYLTQKPNKLKK